jgi:hypothetical protein
MVDWYWVVVALFVGVSIIGIPAGWGLCCLMTVAKRSDQQYVCPHGYNDSNDCPDCRH